MPELVAHLKGLRRLWGVSGNLIIFDHSFCLRLTPEVAPNELSAFSHGWVTIGRHVTSFPEVLGKGVCRDTAPFSSNNPDDRAQLSTSGLA